MANFPIPTSLFSRDLVHLCASALEEAWLLVGRHDENATWKPERIRLTLAQGIVIGATVGHRSRPRLVKAALDHLVATMEMGLSPTSKSDGQDRAQALLKRSQVLAALAPTLSEPLARESVTAAADDYARLARTAVSVEGCAKAVRQFSAPA